MSSVSFSFIKFVELLSQESTYDSVRSIAADSFTRENPLFWEHFVRFKRSCYQALLKHVTDKSINVPILGLQRNGAAPIDNIDTLKKALEQSPSKLLIDQLVCEAGQSKSAEMVIIPMKRLQATDIIKLYDNFIAQKAKFELNIDEKSRTAIKDVITKLQERIVQSVKQGTNKFSPNEVLLNTYLVIHDGKDLEPVRGDDLFVSINLFDSVKEHVLQLLYQSLQLVSKKSAQ
jgi:hypothetical protein